MIEFWQIQQEFQNRLESNGVAVRKITDKAIPGEPFVSMELAVGVLTQAAWELFHRELKEVNMERTNETLIVLGVITAIVSGVLYFLDLPIFNPTIVAWVLTIGLVGAAVAAFGLFSRKIWSQ